MESSKQGGWRRAAAPRGGDWQPRQGAGSGRSEPGGTPVSPWYSEPTLVGFLGLGPYVCAEPARFGGIRITKGCEISNSVFIRMEIRI